VKITVYPADLYGCGHFRLIWSCQLLQAAGHEINLVAPHARQLELHVDRKTDTVHDVITDADLIVFQRVTHRFMTQAVPILRAKGVAVVIDIDDDLASIHPSNPAYEAMHPRNEYARDPGQREPRRHSWANMAAACREATLVTVSTPGLMERYARHGRGRVIPNYLPDSYFGVPHTDSGVIGWPAALVSHPDDPSAVGGALARLVQDGAAFQVVGDPTGCGSAFGLSADPSGLSGVTIDGWPAAVAGIGVGIAPLSDTRFNACKSWLKPLEMSALGVPWVASPRAEYARLNRMGAGILAERGRVWYRELDRLRTSPDYRAEVAGRGREVAERLRLRDHIGEVWAAWMAARETESSGSRMTTV
jgi:hypothetical protein